MLRRGDVTQIGEVARAILDGVYVPRFNALDDRAELQALVAEVGTGLVVSTGPDGFPVATLLPIVWRDDVLIMHLARANTHWRSIGAATPGLAVVTGPEAYVSPAWYASKAEHGRVVPTWNYSAVEFRGRLAVHTDADWLLDAVTDLTTLHESGRPEPWSVTDAPEPYLRKQLNAIVGLELVIEAVAGKAKLSQNRSDDDHAGVVAGLRAEGADRERAVADAMGVRTGPETER